MGTMDSAVSFYRNRGPMDLLRYTIPYGTSRLIRISPFNPPSRYNQVRVADDKFKWAPHYKKSNAEALRTAISPGDDVVIVGGGHGVTTVIAANATGKTGIVTGYEASVEQVEQARKTVELNNVDDQCYIKHAIVSQAYDTRGAVDDAKQVSPAELPPCDVIEMDCEGAELDILRDLDNPATSLIIETHPQYYDEPDEAVHTLNNTGYEIRKKWSDPVEGSVLFASRE